MSWFYQSDFEAETVGTLPTNWVANVGTWAVTTTDPVSGVNALAATSNANANFASYILPAGAKGTQYFIVKQKLIETPTGSRVDDYYIAWRLTSGGGPGYLLGLQNTGTSGALEFRWFKITSPATYVQQTVLGTISGWAIGDVVVTRIYSVGSSHYVWVWKDGGTPTAAPTYTITDASYSTGHIGFYRSLATATALSAIDDVQYGDGASAALTLTGASSVNLSATITIRVSLDVFSTATDSIALSDGGAGGSFSANPVSLGISAQWVDFVYTAPSSGASATITATSSTLGLTAATKTLTLVSTGPTTITLSGATSGTVGVASGTITATLDAAATSTVTINLTSSIGGDTFTSTPVTITSGNTTGTFTITPSATTGARTITAAATGLTSGTLSYTGNAAAGPTIPVTDTSVYFSPNWWSDGAGAMQSNGIKASSTRAEVGTRGAYFKTRVTVGAGGSVVLNVDCSALSSLANPAGAPNLNWSVGGNAMQTALLTTATTTVTLATGLSAGTYDVQVWFRSVFITADGSTTANYTSFYNKLAVTSLTLSTGGSVSAPAIKTKRALIYGDSIAEGDRNVSNTRSGTSQDATQVFGAVVADALDAEYGLCGYYGQTWSWLDSTWSNYASGKSRLVSGALAPAPDYIVIVYGDNDGNPGPASATVTSTLTAMAAAAPSAKIILVVPFSGKARTNLTAATLPANCYRVDLARWEMAPGATVWSYDGQHPTIQGHMHLGGMLVAAIRAALPGATTSGGTARGRAVNQGV